MPQLQPDVFAPQLFWLAIIFTLFYLALSRLALPRIERVLANRKAKIDFLAEVLGLPGPKSWGRSKSFRLEMA